MNNKSFRFDPAIPAFLYSTEDGGGGGGVDNPIPPKDNSDKLASIQSKLDALLTKNGNDAIAALTELVKKQFSTENAKNTAENRVIELTANQLDEATKAELEAYRAYGKPDELKNRLTDAEAKAAKADRLVTDKLLSDNGFNPEAVFDLMESKKFQIESRIVKDEKGKESEVPFAIYREGEGEQAKDEAKPFSEFADSKLAVHKASLIKAESQSQGGTGWVKQVNGAQQPAGTLSFEELKQRKLENSEYPTF